MFQYVENVSGWSAGCEIQEYINNRNFLSENSSEIVATQLFKEWVWITLIFFCIEKIAITNGLDIIYVGYPADGVYRILNYPAKLDII